MTPRLDVFGRPISVGDVVAAATPKYGVMVVGCVVSFSPKMVQIEYADGTKKMSHYAHSIAKRDPT